MQISISNAHALTVLSCKKAFTAEAGILVIRRPSLRTGLIFPWLIQRHTVDSFTPSRSAT